MKIKDAVFFWIPGSRVFKVTKPGNVPAGGFTTGAVFKDWTKTDMVSVALADILTAIVRDGVSPEAVKTEILKVDEIRKVLPDDFPC